MAVDENESWLPNLVGGVSIWKLAPDLNEEQFFDGRLLVPETEGSDSLPVRVEWDLTGMLPLAQARAAHPQRVEKAIADFIACLERTARVFEKGGSGYDKYKKAFTVPSIDADGGAYYFFDPSDDKLKVINWGASPRKIRHQKDYVFGYEEFGALIRKAQAGGIATVGGAAIGGAAVANASASADVASTGRSEPAKSEDEKRADEETDAAGVVWGKPWWVWILYLAGLIFLVWLVAALLTDCGGVRSKLTGAPPDAGSTAADAGVDGGGEAPLYGNANDDGGPPATDMGRDGGVVDGGVRILPDGRVIGLTDAGSSTNGEDAGGTIVGDPGGTIVGDPSGANDPGGAIVGDPGVVGPPVRDGRVLYGEYRAPNGDYYYWYRDAAGNPISLPHREYYHPDAAQWRIVGGTGRVHDFSGAGSYFRVYLRPGESFDGVAVQWRDRAGNWHNH